MKITLTKKALTEAPKKYTRLIINEDKAGKHRLVETAEGHLEYQLGIGTYSSLTTKKFRSLVRSIVQAAKSHDVSHLAITFDYETYTKLADHGSEWFYQTLAENLHLTNYEFLAYKSKPKKPTFVEVLLCGDLTKQEKDAFKQGEQIAAAMNNARNIANTSAADMTPADLAKAAKSAVKGTNAKVKVLDEPELKKLKMGALLAVGQGSSNKTKLIVIEYFGAKSKKDKPVILAGKGITYDTGGLNVKPSGAMHDMHMDMAGGSAVIGAMEAVAKLELKKNVVAIIPAAENAVSDNAMRAGDIVTAMDGTTIEVLHTDAEGRMVLADALTYAQKKYNPAVILDVATLTGAALVALGQHTSAIMTKHQKLADTLTKLGTRTGDMMWPLPLWSEYAQYLKSSRADISNISTGFSRWGGAIEGGTFLAHFAPKKTPWAHIDIAPRMTSVPSDKLAKGATGEPVRLLVEFVKSY